MDLEVVILGPDALSKPCMHVGKVLSPRTCKS